MKKSVTFGAKPSAAPDKSADEWVMNRQAENGPAEAETMKRLTIDIPANLHARMKSQCALNGVKMADTVRALLVQHFLTGKDGGK